MTNFKYKCNEEIGHYGQTPFSKILFSPETVLVYIIYTNSKYYQIIICDKITVSFSAIK